MNWARMLIRKARGMVLSIVPSSIPLVRCGGVHVASVATSERTGWIECGSERDAETASAGLLGTACEQSRSRVTEIGEIRHRDRVSSVGAIRLRMQLIIMIQEMSADETESSKDAHCDGDELLLCGRDGRGQRHSQQRARDRAE